MDGGRTGVARRGAVRLPLVWLIGLSVAACAESGAAGTGEPTFARDVAPILNRRCVACHRPEGPGPFALLEHEVAAPLAPRIVQVIEQRIMPPWLPEPGDVEYDGERRVTPDELETIRAWAEAGAPAGDLSELPPPPPEAAPWPLGPPDLMVELEETYAVPASGGDIFRNFVVRIPVEARRWVRGADVRFDPPRVVHHAMLTFDTTASSRQIAAREAGPGFDGMFVSVEATSPSGFMLGWTPGRLPTLAPQELSWALHPGTDLVLQTHLRPDGTPADLSAQVGFYFGDTPPPRTPFLIRLGSMRLDIPPGTTDYTVEDEYVLPVDVDVLGLYPHQHFLGKSIELEAVRPDSTRLRVLRIPRWDFTWQESFQLAEPLALAAGTRFEARLVWDNSAQNPANPSDPPRRVVYGPTATDEMGDVWIQVVPRRAEDLATLTADFGRKEAGEMVASWRQTLETRPDDPQAPAGLGTWAQARGDHETAVGYFRSALALEPAYVLARYNLALSLESLGRREEAAAEYRRVLADDPDHADAANNLATMAALAGRLDEAVSLWEQAVESEPTHARAHNNLGNALRQRGDLSESVRHLLRAVELEPEYPEAHFNLGMALRSRGDAEGSVAAFRQAAAARASWSLPRQLAAWTLATHPSAAVRDPTAAVRLAEEAVALGGETPDPLSLDVLAAAYAAAGDFQRAVTAAERAIAALERGGARGQALLPVFTGRLALYREGRPYIAPLP